MARRQREPPRRFGSGGPPLKLHRFPERPHRDDFEGDRLGPEWIHVRNVGPGHFSLKDRRGFLRLWTLRDSLFDKRQVPAFAGQLQPDFRVTARTVLEFTPRRDGEEAGLCVRANDDNHDEIAVGRLEGRTEIFVRNHVQARSVMVARRAVEGRRFWWEISGGETQYQFAFSAEGGEWETLTASPAADLSRGKAGGSPGRSSVFTPSRTAVHPTTTRISTGSKWSRGEPPQPVALSPRPTPTPLPPRDTWRIRAGGDAFRDRSGNAWAPDTAFTGGETVKTHFGNGGTRTLPDRALGPRFLLRVPRSGGEVPGHPQVRRNPRETTGGARLYGLSQRE